MTHTVTHAGQRRGFSYLLLVFYFIFENVTAQSVCTDEIQANNTEPLLVDLFFGLKRLRSISEANQDFLLQLFLTMRWNNTVCLHRPYICQNLNPGDPPFQFVYFANLASVEYQVVSSSCVGEIESRIYLLLLTLEQHYDLSLFYYDNQTLLVDVQGWQNRSVLRFNASVLPELVDPLMPNGWLQDGDIHWEQSASTWMGNDYERVLITLPVVRISSAWDSSVRLPLVVILLFTWATFLMGCNEGALGNRLMTCFTALLAVVVFKLSLATEIPSTGTPTFADALVNHAFMSVISVFALTVILRLLLANAGHLPQWVQRATKWDVKLEEKAGESKEMTEIFASEKAHSQDADTTLRPGQQKGFVCFHFRGISFLNFLFCLLFTLVTAVTYSVSL